MHAGASRIGKILDDDSGITLATIRNDLPDATLRFVLSGVVPPDSGLHLAAGRDAASGAPPIRDPGVPAR